MKSLNKAVVTGATSGIGSAIVVELRNSGREVLAIGRRADKLKKISADTGAIALVADIQNIEDFTAQLSEFQPDILVNNAGVGHGIDSLLSIEPKIVQEAIDTNVSAPIQLTSLLIPSMLARQQGHIVNIGSIAGLHTMISALYGATKSAIHLFSQNLRNELAGSGIRVTEICPGRTSTEFYQAAKGTREKLNKMSQSNIRELKPEDVANTVLYAINAPEHVNISTIEILPTDQIVGGIRMAPLHQSK